MSQAELANHLMIKYYVAWKGILITPMYDVPKPQDPEVIFNESGLKPKEVQEFVSNFLSAVKLK